LHETPEVGNGQKQTESGRHLIGIGQHPGADGYLGSSREPIAGNEMKSWGIAISGARMFQSEIYFYS
jgi:hypothetical protein